jgi:uncharacterized protein (UPF0332 family)
VAGRDAHVEQARNNRRLAEELLNLGTGTGENLYLQWAVTAAFYASVHCIEAHLATQQLHSQHHKDRETKMGVHCPVPICTAHSMLQDFSTEARYLLGTFDANWVQTVVLNKYLARITRFVQI